MYFLCRCYYCSPGHLQTSTLKAGGSVTTVTWSNLLETPTTETGCIPRGWAVTGSIASLQVWAQVNMRYPFVTVDNFQLAWVHSTISSLHIPPWSTPTCNHGYLFLYRGFWMFGLTYPSTAIFSIVFICYPLVPRATLFCRPSQYFPP